MTKCKCLVRFDAWSGGSSLGGSVYTTFQLHSQPEPEPEPEPEPDSPWPSDMGCSLRGLERLERREKVMEALVIGMMVRHSRKTREERSQEAREIRMCVCVSVCVCPPLLATADHARKKS